MRKLEKISYKQFQKDICSDEELYSSYPLPVRKTKSSAGYDFASLFDFVLHPGELKKIPLGIKVSMNEGEVFLIFVRSSMGFKYNVRFTNQVGVIDGDYYNNEENEGHMYISIQNEGNQDFVVHKGDNICQGIFTHFLKVEDEQEIVDVRAGGFGSTNKGDGISE